VLKTRIIPSLLYKDFGLVKGRQFDSSRAVGSPMQAVKVYNMRDVDELLFLDVTATLQGRSPDFDLIDDLADECFMPLTVGGGVRSIEDVRRLLEVGADKVAMNSTLIESPELVLETARRFGSQCIVASIDTRKGENDTPEVWIRSGTRPTGRHPVDVARDVQARGAGEIVLTSIDRDGTMTGYDLPTLELVAEAVTIPVIASGGAGSYDDLRRAIDAGASAVAAASIFHFTEQTPIEAKLHLQSLGVPVRIPHV
jgi:cyclase